MQAYFGCLPEDILGVHGGSSEDHKFVPYYTNCRYTLQCQDSEVRQPLELAASPVLLPARWQGVHCVVFDIGRKIGRLLSTAEAGLACDIERAFWAGRQFGQFPVKG